MNPRRRARDVRDPQGPSLDLLRRMEQAVAEVRSLARTLGGQPARPRDVGPGVPRAVELAARRDGPATSAADPEALHAVRRRLEELAEELLFDRAPPEWPIHGALIVNLRNILDAMDRVAEANPIGGSRVPIRVPRRRAARVLTIRGSERISPAVGVQPRAPHRFRGQRPKLFERKPPPEPAAAFSAGVCWPLHQSWRARRPSPG